MQQLSRIAIFVLSFGLARGGLFVAPILLSNLLFPENYGQIELTQAIAAVAVPLLSLGTAGVIPLALIRHMEKIAFSSVLMHQLGIAFLSIPAILLGYFLVGDITYWLAPLVISIVMLQGLWSVALKSQSRNEASLLLDAGFWVVSALAASFAFLFDADMAFRWRSVLFILLTYYVGLLAWTAMALIHSDVSQAIGRYFQTIRAGLPLMLGGLLTFFATTSGRLGLGIFSTPEMVADYAILFRATALPIVIHQLVTVAGFRHIYEWPESELKKKLPLILFAVILGVVAFAIIGESFAFVLGPAFQMAYAQHKSEGLLILTQCILWSGISLNDMTNSRRQTAGKVAFFSTAYFVLVLPCVVLFLTTQNITLERYVPVHSLVMLGFYLSQVFVMWVAGIRLATTWALAIISFVALSLLFSFLS